MPIQKADLIFSLLPLVVLIYLMTKKKSLASYVALPCCALLLYLVKLIYFKTNPNLVNATVIEGLLTAWTPLLIVWGAILLFKTMEHSGSMDTIRTWLNSITPNRVAQLMIVGWSFSFLIEGASGFGTPAALAAPILVGLGVKPVRAAIVCLIMNSVPVSFGAVGTPIWFGLAGIGLGAEEILRTGLNTAIIHCFAALVIPVIALLFVVEWKQIRQNLLFIYSSILACIVPYLIFASFNYEFPAIAGGLVGLVSSVLLAKKGIGLAKEDSAYSRAAVGIGTVIKALFPLWATTLVLLVTRINQFGLKALLTATSPEYNISLGTLGQLSITPAMVISLKNIFSTDAGWTHKLLYVPSIIPFFVISGVSFLAFRMSGQTAKTVWVQTFAQMKKPILALSGALVFVKLLMVSGGGESACTIIIGQALANCTGRYWQYFASYLGALGAFFSGSNTVSNLTFGPIQDSIAKSLGISRLVVLSAQSVGGAMGNMVCINNIVAVCSVLGINDKEGFILKRTVWPMLVYGLVAAVVSHFL